MTRRFRPVSPRPRRARGSFIVGLAIGLLLGLAIALGVALFLSKTPIPFMGKGTKAAATKESEPAKVAGMPQGGAAPGPSASLPPTAVKGADKPKYDFYKILPGNEEPVSERELKEAARAAKGQPDAGKDVYFIQAGSFQNPADADNQKAKIAILGFESSVEPTSLPDKGTWYRVRLGPYTSLEDLNKVRRTLSQNGIDASLVKMKDVTAKAH
ncbi:MAG TPA: SPOR domain-containing protein [Burkholderiales bacterium]|nr:SPOR domain-containing protein [Burkholderiales bacterium]